MWFQKKHKTRIAKEQKLPVVPDKYMRAPFLEEMSVYTQHVRRNLIVGSSVVLLFNLNLIDTAKPILGITFHEFDKFDKLGLYWFLLAILLYLLTHFIALALIHFLEWRARLAGDQENFGKMETFQDLGGRDIARKKQQSNMYSVFSAIKEKLLQYEIGVTSFYKHMTDLINKSVSSGTYNLEAINELKFFINSNAGDALKSGFPWNKDVLEALTRLEEKSLRYENYMKFLKNFENMSFILFEMLLPVIFGIYVAWLLLNKIVAIYLPSGALSLHFT